MKRTIATLVAAGMLVGAMAVPASADDPNFVDFVAAQAEMEDGQFNIIGNVVLALVESGDLTEEDVAALSTAEITAFLPKDWAFRKLVAALDAKTPSEVSEGDVIPFLVGALGLPTIAEVVKYHIYAGGKVDFKTARGLDTNKRNGTEVFIEMYNGGDLGIDRRFKRLQLDEAGDAGLGTNNPFVVKRNIDAGNALVHGLNEVLLP